MRLILVLVCGMGISLHTATAAAESLGQIYTLDMIVELALAKNPAVSFAEGNIEKQKGQQTAAGAYPNPTVSGHSGFGKLKDTTVGPPENITSITEYNATVGQPIEWPLMRAARKGAAEAGFVASTVGLVETKLNLTAAVKIAFYELLLAQRVLDLAKQNGQIVEDVRRIVGVRVRSGEAPQFEAIKAEVEVLKANQLITRAENTVLVTRVAIDTLTGGALGSSFVITGEFETFRRDMTVNSLLARAAEKHPTLQRLAKLIEQADRTVEFQRQSRVPTLTLNGSFWREIGREAVQGGLSLPLPLWYRREGEIATALGAKRSDEAEWLRSRNVILKEVNQYFQEAQTTANLIEVFEKGLLKQAQEALRIAQFSFQQGASSLLEVLDAQRVQRDILRDYAQARFDLSVSLARLERAVGGLL